MLFGSYPFEGIIKDFMSNPLIEGFTFWNSSKGKKKTKKQVS